MYIDLCYVFNKVYASGGGGGGGGEGGLRINFARTLHNWLQFFLPSESRGGEHMKI